MAEAMTVELMIEAFWSLQGYLARVRVPYQTPKHGWSDFDVVAYHPDRQTVVVSESKVQGPADQVYVFNDQTRKRWTFSEWAEKELGYLNFLNGIPNLWTQNLLFGDVEKFRDSIERLHVQLVSNAIVALEQLDGARESLQSLLLGKLHDAGWSGFIQKIDVSFTTPFELFCKILEEIRDNPQGRRYGNPILDLARELNRFLHPSTSYGGYGAKRWVIERTRDTLDEATKKARGT